MSEREPTAEERLERILAALEGVPLPWATMNYVLEAAPPGEWVGTIWVDSKGDEQPGLYVIRRFPEATP